MEVDEYTPKGKDGQSGEGGIASLVHWSLVRFEWINDSMEECFNEPISRLGDLRNLWMTPGGVR